MLFSDCSFNGTEKLSTVSAKQITDRLPRRLEICGGNIPYLRALSLSVILETKIWKIRFVPNHWRQPLGLFRMLAVLLRRWLHLVVETARDKNLGHLALSS